MVDTSDAFLLEKLAPNLTAEVRSYLGRHRSELERMLGSGDQSGAALGRRHSKIMDGLLTAIYPAAFAAMERQKRWRPVLLAAVGGYGRGMVGLRSDLDMRLLTAQSPDRISPIAQALFYPLWDAGVSLGHQVVSVSDAIAHAWTDLPSATALLDWRPIAGDQATGEPLLNKAFSGIFSEGEVPVFLQRLEAEVQERHRRFGGSVYLLEPDVKNGAGGLRDLDVALWAARARWRVDSLQDLVRIGVLIPREAGEMLASSDFLWSVRNHLHHQAGRRSDRLTFDQQEIVAHAMGYDTKLPGRASGANEAQMVEALMSDYYRHARALTLAREQILSRAAPPWRSKKNRPQEVDLGRGLRSVDERIDFASSTDVGSDPSACLRLYQAAVARNAPVSPAAREVVTRLASDHAFATSLRANAEAADIFVRLVCSSQDTRLRNGSILEELHDVGLVLAMIPEFSPLVGRVHHDLYHVYTVDVHSVAAVDRLHAMVRGDLAGEYPLACRLAAELTRPAVLFLATLLHDVGKAIGGKGHATKGADMARSILVRLGLAEDDVDQACHLIAQHLSMYLTSTRRDLSDPVTVIDFARDVRGREGLRELYLLSVADLSTTSPTSMTEWKARMLDDLFLATDTLLSGRPADAARVAHVRESVKRQWGSQEDPFLDDFLATMPERYLLANSSGEIAAHAALVQRAEQEPVVLGLVPSHFTEAAEICVVADDRPGLLAAITAAIGASRLEVHTAQINSRIRPDGRAQAVDAFWVSDHIDGGEGVARGMPKLYEKLRDVIVGQTDPREMAKRRRPSRWAERPSPTVASEVSIDDRASREHTVIEVITRDRTGLLFTLALALHDLGLSISVAKINTEGNRVADVFYVTESDGSKIQPGDRTLEIRDHLVFVLSDLAKEAP
jgi:[protein-PII] uridylyltransferase